MIINLNGVDIFYKQSGSGHPLLLLHGFDLDHSIFDELTEKLKKHYTVYAMDTRSHGQSSKTAEYSYTAMANDVYGLINSLNLGKVYLLGFSDGAVISLHLALMHPEVLEKVAFLGLNLKSDDMREKYLRYFEARYKETGDFRYQLALVEPHIETDTLNKITIPTLLMAAEFEMFREGLFEEMAAAFPNLHTAKIMQGHKHESYMVHNDLLYPDLLDFFG